MTTMSWRVVVIGVDLPDDLGAQLEAWLLDRVPDGVVEVRRTVTSVSTRDASSRKICE